MKRSFQLILLLVLLFLIVIASFVVLLNASEDMNFLHDAINQKLLPFIFLGCMAVVFQIKQLRMSEHQRIIDDKVLDRALDENVNHATKSRWMLSLLLCYFLLGGYVVVNSIMGFRYLTDYFPLEKLPDGIDRYAIAFFFFVFGMVLLLDAWRNGMNRPKKEFES